MSTTNQNDNPPTGDESYGISLEDAFALAQQMHRDQQFEGAQTLYERILGVAPDYADAWHFLGLVRYQQHQVESGVKAVRHALAIAPDYPDAHANLANMLLERGDVSGAEWHLVRALELCPDAIPPCLALAALRRAQGKLQESAALIAPLLERAPGNALVQYAMGHVQAALGNLEAAVQHYNEALILDPALGVSRERLGIALFRMGKIEEARFHFRQWIELEPDDPTPKYLLAACGGAEAPVRAPDDYIRYTFDQFASSFDARLSELAYRAPQLIEHVFSQVFGAATASRAVLDAGCGTGLLAERVRTFAGHLTGVDLSAGMLARAGARQLYDELVESELGDYLRGNLLRFDVVASSDTLCYFGALEEVMSLAYGALRTNGWLFFTVEDGGDLPGGYVLQYHGRYAHQNGYIEKALWDAGFGEIRIASDILRTERRKPVPGLVVAAKKSS